MGAKLIFFKSPSTGLETFSFCPLVSDGCANCFLPPKCKGEKDKNKVFNLREVKGKFVMSAYRQRN